MSRDKEIFLEALDRSAGAERSSFLLSACSADMALRRRVEELLQAHERAGDFLRGDPDGSRFSAGSAPSGDALSEGPGTVIGRYKLLQKIGEGGFGVVYMAEQREPVKRKVALKIIKLGMDTKQVVGRFEAERQALAMMEHPNIARVLDAGATETPVAAGVSPAAGEGILPPGPTPGDSFASKSSQPIPPGTMTGSTVGETPATTLTAGRPYFVMELVRGVPITQFCDENRLTTDERLRLFIQICQAIQHAHQKGIIHRDVKPGNVLITMHDDRAVPKVIDFGIAKAIGQDLTDKTVFTRLHELLGTPAYMSPEQTHPSGLDIDTRSDIYSLGVLLYVLLAGRTPFDVKELLSVSYDELRRRIREEEPLKPSTRLNTLAAEDRTTIARDRKSDPHHLRRTLKRDLDWIVMKALEKDRSRRYESAAAFAHDIERYLRDEAVTAVAPSVGYRFRKFARRHRTALATALALLAILVAATLVSSWLAVRATFAERTAKSLLETEQHSRRQLERMLGELKEARLKEEALRRQAHLEAARARTEAATADAVARFVNEDLFAAADPENEPDREITLRTVLDRASQQLNSSLTNQPVVAASIHRTIGRAYRNLSLHAPAAEHLRRAHELYLRELGERDVESITALSDYSDTLEKSLKRTDAIGLARQAYALANKYLGERHPIAVRCGSRLAWMLYRNRIREEAFALVEKTYLVAQDAPDVEPRDLLSVMTLVAFNRGAHAKQDYPSGERVMKQALKLVEDRFGPSHLQTVRAKANLAVYYYDRDIKAADSERLFEDVLESYRRSLGESHERTLISRGNVGLFNERARRPAITQYQYLKILEHQPDSRRPLEILPRLLQQLPLRPVVASDAIGTAWRVSTNAPVADWQRTGFDERSWSPLGPNAGEEAWFRLEFELGVVPTEPFVFTIAGWGEFEIFINGTPAGTRFGSAGKIQIAVAPSAMTKALHVGPNVIAMHGLKLRPAEPVRLGVYYFPPEPAR